MPDVYEAVRVLPLQHVLSFLGVSTEWKSRKAGTEWYGACPLHQAKKNQTSFSFDAEGRFNCFSCGKKGRGAIDVTMALKGLGFREAVELLQSHTGNIIAQQAVKPVLKQLLKKPNEMADVSDGKGDSALKQTLENHPFRGTYEKFAVESDWLKRRGLLPATCERFEVFEYNNPKRRSAYTGSVMLKICRYSDGECVGYLSRNTGAITAEAPKYRFPKGFQKHFELFGAWQIKNDAKQLPLRVAYVVESPFAVLKFAQLGLAAVSPFGWSLSAEQVEICAQLAKGFVYLSDANKTEEIGPSVLALGRRCWVRCPRLPQGVEDPEQLDLETIRSLTG